MRHRSRRSRKILHGLRRTHGFGPGTSCAPAPAPQLFCGGLRQFRRLPCPITSRSIPLAIILSIVTCGIYGLYWLYCLVNDLNTASGHEQDTSGGMVILFSIITCGIYGLYWYYTAGRKVNEIQEYGRQPQDTYLGILYLVLDLVGFSIVSMALIQNELNKVAGL